MRTRLILALAAVGALAACGPKVTTIDVAPASITLTKKGETAKLRVTPKDAEGRVIDGLTPTYTSSAAAVAAVDATGKITAATTGSANIKVAYGEQKGVEIPVKVMIPAAIKPSQTEVKLDGVGAKAPISAKAITEKGDELELDVEWKSENPAVAEVKGGEITAMSVGETKVIASVGDIKAEVAVTVLAPALDKIEVPSATLEMKVGKDPQTITPVAKDTQGNVIANSAFTFASSNEKVAVVDASGVVTAKGKGKAEVTVASGDKTATVEVTVAKK
jgi:uncharacterized protein YjdB